MKNFVKIVGIVIGFVLLVFFDVISLGVVSEAEAVLGVRRRTARRTAVVVGGSEAAAASTSTAATQQQQAATAQQQSETAQQQSATAQQQSATAQQQAAAAPAPAPTAMVASLPSGCVSDGAVFKCGNVYYKAYMSGSTIVYGVVPAP